jgi:hypothetical protein
MPKQMRYWLRYKLYTRLHHHLTIASMTRLAEYILKHLLRVPGEANMILFPVSVFEDAGQNMPLVMEHVDYVLDRAQ